MSLNITQVTAGEAFERFRNLWRGQKPHLIKQRDLMLAPTVSATVLAALIAHFNQIIAIQESLASTPGLAEYARTQFNDVNFNVGPEYVAYRNACIAATVELEAVYNGSQVRDYTAAQVANAVTLLNAVIAALG